MVQPVRQTEFCESAAALVTEGSRSPRRFAQPSGAITFRLMRKERVFSPPPAPCWSDTCNFLKACPTAYIHLLEGSSSSCTAGAAADPAQARTRWIHVHMDYAPRRLPSLPSEKPSRSHHPSFWTDALRSGTSCGGVCVQTGQSVAWPPALQM